MHVLLMYVWQCKLLASTIRQHVRCNYLKSKMQSATETAYKSHTCVLLTLFPELISGSKEGCKKREREGLEKTKDYGEN